MSYSQTCIKFTSLKKINFADQKNAFCTFHMINSNSLKRNVTNCKVHQSIESEEYVLVSPNYTTVELLNMENKREVKYLPKRIGERFPNLKEIWAFDCELTVVRDHYFEDLKKLRFLHMYGNKISVIEPSAFKDLTSVEKVDLRGNMIKTLDNKLFITMVNLKEIHLNNNKIDFLKTTTFKIPNGKLFHVDLRENVCIENVYKSNMRELEFDLRHKCNKRAPLLDQGK